MLHCSDQARFTSRSSLSMSSTTSGSRWRATQPVAPWSYVMIVGEYDAIISGTALLVGQPERDQLRAGQLGGRVGDGPQEGVELERARDATVHVGERADARGLGVLGLVERGVADRDGGLLGEELERGGLFAAEGALGPVVHDQRAEDPVLHG